MDDGLGAGDQVVVEDHRGTPIGVGLYNPHSLIAVRLYARHVRITYPELSSTATVTTSASRA